MGDLVDDEAEVPISAEEGHRILSLVFFNFSIVRRSFLFDFFFFFINIQVKTPERVIW